MAAILRQVFEQVGVHCQRTAGTYFTHGVDPAREITPRTSCMTTRVGWYQNVFIPECLHSGF